MGSKWAVSARNEPKARDVLEKIGAPEKDILVAELVCSTEEDRSKLRAVVERTKVVLIHFEDVYMYMDIFGIYGNKVR